MKTLLKTFLTIILLFSVTANNFIDVSAKAQTANLTPALRADEFTPTQLTPNGAGVNTKPAYTWSAITGAAKYVVVIKKGLVITTVTALPKLCKLNICTLKSPKTLTIGSYSWTVQAYIGLVPQAVSSEMAFSIASTTPVQVSPRTFAAVAHPLIINWLPVPTATSYQVINYFGKKGTTYNISATICGPALCTYQLPQLPLGTYSWKIKAYFGKSGKSFSTNLAFTVTELSNLVPTPASPSGIVTDNTPSYSWNTMSPATKYEYNVFKGGDLIIDHEIAASECTITACTHTAPEFVLNGDYTWTVRAFLYGDWQPYSDPQSFTADGPMVTTLVSPVDMTYDKMPTFIWSKLDTASHYNVRIYHQDEILVDQTVSMSVCGATNCSFTIDTDLASGEFFWQVSAFIDGTWYDYTSLQHFANTSEWHSVNGHWNKTNASIFSTQGIDNEVHSSIAKDGSFDTLTFEVKMKRLDCGICANYLIVRGDPASANGLQAWHDSVRFQYTNDGYYAVYQTSDGNVPAMADWYPTSAIIAYDWNTIKVVTSGSNMVFYINDNIVWAGSIETALPSGQLGIGMSDFSDNLFEIESAQISTIADIGVQSAGMMSSQSAPIQGSPDVSP